MKILIVEDSKFSQKVATRLFAEAFPAAELILADNGVAGYEKFMQVHPDVIVTDLLMPQMTGQEMIRKIRIVDQNILIFPLTADVQQSTKAELAEFNITALINKPLNQEKLVLVEKIVGEKLHDAK
ncbi:CheY-like chemotaxis protein [Sporomusaceae bacterium BoRhaA]|uniref:response regulator transcription factor n=1 Tax=Pelorhabdus rhamnosifermentans TaxID=2772457 RepID=UPI001C064588|nr:response regulator [Pelorhabdus rhamnosifermentans]MBU2699352.1 CheY-like chemotaxis protein [Pelorhabdus rhamnosifermentans]